MVQTCVPLPVNLLLFTRELAKRVIPRQILGGCGRGENSFACCTKSVSGGRRLSSEIDPYVLISCEEGKPRAFDFGVVPGHSNSRKNCVLMVVCPAHWCGISRRIDIADWDWRVDLGRNDLGWAPVNEHCHFHSTDPERALESIGYDLAIALADRTPPAPAAAPDLDHAHCGSLNSHRVVDIPGCRHLGLVQALATAFDRSCDHIDMMAQDSGAIAGDTGCQPLSGGREVQSTQA